MSASINLRLGLTLRAACLVVLSATAASAADCLKAADAVDKALCGDPRAKAADEGMAKAYDALKAGLDGTAGAQLLVNQRNWLGARKATCPEDGETEAACLARWSETRRRNLAGDPAEGPGAPGRLVPSITAKAGAEGHWTTDLFLFRFAAPQGPGEAAFNAAVDKAMTGVSTPMDGAGDGQHGTWSLDGSIAYASARLVSMRVDGAEFAAGAAHGLVWTQNINVDLRAAKLLTIADVVAPGKIKSLADLCSSQIGAQLADRYRAAGSDTDKDEMRDELAGMHADIVKVTADLSHWIFGATNATVFYDQDAIASHALGAFTCRVPYAQLRPLAKPGTPLPDGTVTAD